MNFGVVTACLCQPSVGVIRLDMKKLRFVLLWFAYITRSSDQTSQRCNDISVLRSAERVDPEYNDSNFRALLDVDVPNKRRWQRFAVACKFSTAKRHPRSPQIENELIVVAGNLVNESVIRHIKWAKCDDYGGSTQWKISCLLDL